MADGAENYPPVQANQVILSCAWKIGQTNRVPSDLACLAAGNSIARSLPLPMEEEFRLVLDVEIDFNRGAVLQDLLAIETHVE